MGGLDGAAEAAPFQNYSSRVGETLYALADYAYGLFPLLSLRVLARAAEKHFLRARSLIHLR
jgi:hypothetical protein